MKCLPIDVLEILMVEPFLPEQLLLQLKKHNTSPILKSIKIRKFKHGL